LEGTRGNAFDDSDSAVVSSADDRLRTTPAAATAISVAHQRFRRGDIPGHITGQPTLVGDNAFMGRSRTGDAENVPLPSATQQQVEGQEQDNGGVVEVEEEQVGSLPSAPCHHAISASPIGRPATKVCLFFFFVASTSLFKILSVIV